MRERYLRFHKAAALERDHADGRNASSGVHDPGLYRSTKAVEGLTGRVMNSTNEDLLSARDLMAQLEEHLGLQVEEKEESAGEDVDEEDFAVQGSRRSASSLRSRISQRSSSGAGRRRASRYDVPGTPAARAAAPSPSRVRQRPTRIHRRSRIPSSMSRRSKEIVEKKSAHRGRGRKASLTTSVENGVKKLHSARGVLGRVNAALELARVG